MAEEIIDPGLEPDNGGGAVAEGAAENGGGSENQDWRAALPEELRSNPALANFKDPASLAKSYLSTKSLVGKRTTVLPDEHSSEADRRAFYAAGGCPESAELYKVERTLPEEMRDPEGMKAFQSVAWQHGVSNAALAALTAEFDRQILGYQEQAKAAAQAAETARDVELTKLFGREKDAALERVGQTLNILDPDKAISRDLLKDVGAVRLLDSISRRLLGDELKGQGSAETLADLDEQVSALRANPAFADDMNPDHDNLMVRYKALQQRKSQMRRR